MISTTDTQRLLRAAGYYAGDLDGDLGPKTREAIQKVLEANADTLPAGWLGWPTDRKSALAVQVILKAAGFEIVGALDGYAGMLTKQALTEWNHEQASGHRPKPWRPDDTPKEDDDRPIPAWGRQKDMERRFGPAGGSQCTAGKVKLPYTMRIAWNLSSKIDTFSCHEDVADSVERVLNRVASEYSPEEIVRAGLDLFGGCYNFRKKRGGSSLSTHAYGVAIDWDPERNQLKWTRSRARLALPDAEVWWRCWEAEGWLSLGRARDFDWMHVQAPGL